MTEIVVDSPAAVAAALDDDALIPQRSTDPSVGATMQLRAAMARFSDPSSHPPRRVAVDAALDGIDQAAVRAVAAELALARLTGDQVDVLTDVAATVPTLALGRLLGLPALSLGDVEAVVRVIGRGEQATAAADAATARLLATVGDVATASLIYQNFDATAALIATTLGTGDPPRAAVPRTRRLAVADTVLAGRAVAASTSVVIEIGAAGFPFGAGPHECPGRSVAESIVAGVGDALAASGMAVDHTATVVDADGRPTTLIACRKR